MTAKYRDIIVRLTPAQYEALAGAIATEQLHMDDRIEDGDKGAKRSLAVLNRAWESVNRAWYRAEMGF